MRSFNFRKLRLVSAFAITSLAFNSSHALAADYYWKTDGTGGAFTGAFWTLGSATATGGSTWPGSTSNNAVFSAASIVTSATATLGNLSVINGSLVSFTNSGSSTFFNGGVIHTLDVGTGSYLDLSNQAISTDAGTGFTKNGAGTVYMVGNSGVTGGFTLNAGMIIIGGISTLGGSGSTITINGGAIATRANVVIAGTHTLAVGGDFTIGGATNAATTNNASDTATIELQDAINLGAATRTINIGSNGTYTLSGVISGAANTGLTVTASAGATGKLVLKGANTYTGPTTINSGMLSYSASNVIPNTSNVIVDGASAELALNGFSDTVGGITLDNGGKISGATLTATKSIELKSGTVSAVLAGSVAMNKTTSGTVFMGASSSYTGLTTISDGTLAYLSSNMIGSGGVTVNGANAVLDLGTNHSDSVGAVTLDGGGSITGSGTSALTSTASFDLKSGSVTAILAGSAIPASKTTSGVVTLTGASTYSGITTLSDGVLRVGRSTAGTNTQPTSGPVGIGTLSLAGGTFSSTDNTARTIQNALSLTGNFTLGDETYSGKLTFPNATTLTGTRQITVASDVELSGVISTSSSPTFGLIKAGAGTLTLSGMNVYGGDTTLTDGRLQLGRSSAGSVGSITNGPVGVGALVLNGGTLSSDSTTARTLLNPATIGGNVTLGDGTNNTGKVSLLAGATLTGTRQLTVASDAELGGVISDGGSKFGLTKIGSGALELSGASANTYTGTTTVTQGTLHLGKTADGVTAVAGDLTINGGTVDYSQASNEQIANTANVSISAGALAFGARVETIGSAGAGGFSMTGGSISTSGSIGLNRSMTISGGSVSVTSSGTISANGNLVFGGGTIDFTNTSASSNAALNLRGGGGTGITYPASATATAQITNSGGGSNRVSLNTSGSTVFDIADAPLLANEMSIGAIISGGAGAALAKQGAGTLTLSGANNYQGGTTISGGTLVANAPRVAGGNSGLASSSTGTDKVSVNDGGTLAGNGGVGAVDVNSGGTITAGDGAASGNATGTLTTGNQKWFGGGTFQAKFANSAAAAGGTGAWDVLSMGTLDLTSLSASNKFNLTLLKTTAGTFNPANGTTFSLISFTGITYPSGYSATNIADLFVLNTDQLGGSYADESRFAFSVSSSAVSLSIQPAAAPEPTTAALFSIGGSVLLGRRRRQKINKVARRRRSLARLTRFIGA